MSDLATVLRLLFAALIPAIAVLLFTFAVPPLALDGALARIAFVVAEAGDTLGCTILAALLIAVIAGRPGIGGDRRLREAVAIGVAATLFLGGGAVVNEHGIKPWFGVARPSIVELETMGALKMGSLDFYALGGKAERSAYLEQRFSDADYAGPLLDANVRSHWAHMTGYSFPSGHSFASMLLATFFLATGLTFLPLRRAWPFFLLVPWAVAVGYSRVLLRVHSPLDVNAGALQGIAVGLVAFLLVRALLVVGPESAARDTEPQPVADPPPRRG